jgi:hypothetical protein
MAKQITHDQMANVRRSLAEAGIYFDKLYINQAYFNSHITLNEPTKKHSKASPNVWEKLLCGRSKCFQRFPHPRVMCVAFRNQTNSVSHSNK